MFKNISVCKITCSLLSVVFFFLINPVFPQESTQSKQEGQVANGVYLVLQRSENPKEIPNANDDQLRVTDAPEFSEDPANAPTEYFLVAKQPYIPLILESLPTKEKDQKGNPVLLIKLAEKYVPLLKEFTAKHIGSRVAIIIGGKVMSVNKIRTEIPDGQVKIFWCTNNACEAIYVKLTENFNPNPK